MQTSAASALRVERDRAGFATVTFDRPGKLNTLSIALRRELAETAEALSLDPDVRVLIVTGTGRAFTAGLDLDEWAGRGEEDLAAGRVEGAGAYHPLTDAVAGLHRFNGPVIAAVNGLCITGGLEIALACDLAIASTEARFADTHVKVGLLPGWGGSVRLLHRVGLHRAKELALTGRFLSAEEALAWGLVNRVVPASELLSAARALATAIASNPADGVAAYRRLLDQASCMSVPEALLLERQSSLEHNLRVSHATIVERLDRLRRNRA